VDSIIVACDCGARVKMPPSVAGKKVRCPKCGGVLSVPEAAAEPSPPASSAALKSFGAEAPKVPKAEMPKAAPPSTKSCLYCGEQILASAKKCKHCGEFIEDEEVAGSPALPTRRLAPAAKVAAPDPNSDPNPAEYFAAILLAPVGLIIGGVWAAMKLPKAKKMIQVSATMNVIYGVAALLLWMYVFREADNAGAAVDQAVLDRNRMFGIPRESNEFEDNRPEQAPPPQQSQRSGLPPVGEVDLEGQPPLIQKAMKANVLISLDQGLGSGVVVQRNGDEALILTNHHVVDIAFARSHGLNSTPLKDIAKLKVLYFNQMSFKGTVTWVAPDGIDLALVRAAIPPGIEPVQWQGMPKVSASDEVFAVGNPQGLGWTYTKGVVSATRKHKYPPDRPVHEVPVIQTDASITFGNSGGGLYSSTDGQLIGINSFIADPSGGKGLGFAIRATVLLDLKPDGLILPRPSTPK
jgi:Trypsin-like peptidase domain